MKKITYMKHFIAIALAIYLIPYISAYAQEQNKQNQKNEDITIVKVGDDAVTRNEAAFYLSDITTTIQAANMTPALRYAFAVDNLVERALLAKAALEVKIEETDDFKKRMAFYREKALRDSYFIQRIHSLVKEDEIKKFYDENVANANAEKTVRASHILVKDEKTAEDIIEELKKGADFEKIAQEKSIDTQSAQKGGDLGFFTQNEMVKPFAEKAFSLEIGEISEAVQTNFGWHIIKLNEKGERNPPKLEEVKENIRAFLVNQAIQREVDVLKLKANIEVVDADFQKLLDQIQTPQQINTQNNQESQNQENK